MKSILVPVEFNDLLASAMACGRLLAQRFGATLEGVALRVPQFAVVGPDPVVTVTFPTADQDDREYVARARRSFEGFFSNHGQADAARVAYRWRAGDPVDDASLGSLARVYDLSVIGRPQGMAQSPRMSTLEAGLFDSGRPVLMAPPKAPHGLGERIVISWNQSEESARTVAYALPLLAQAREVTVLTIEGSTVPGPSGVELANYLAMHGITAREVTMGAQGRRSGEAILAETTRLGADLLVKGAYTQSRLRQMIFGGATSHILAHSELPVFIAH